MTAVLKADDLTLGYRGIAAVHQLNLSVQRGEVVAIVGANGAGKTTSLLGLAGAIPAIAGNVQFDGVDQRAGLTSNARRGMALLTDDRSIFRELTTWQNLRLGRGAPEEAIAAFPALDAIRHRKAGLLSGGEQQMLGLARVIAARPKLLLADELSLGLAPIVMGPLFAALRRLADDEGSAVVLVEQHIHLALSVADSVVVLQRGATVDRGPADQFRHDNERIARAYLSAPPEAARL
jgi:branched-chain amino acid transport system ATP-binding protein